MAEGNGETIIIGSRASRLALWQANWVRDRLAAIGHAARIVEISTSGDRVCDRPLAALGGRGVFVREIEESLSAGKIDLAVHSLKDLPTEQPEALTIACVPEREDPHDLLAAPGAPALTDLPSGAVVGTGSPRRACQILRLRGDLQIRDIRGNVDTRIAKLQRGEYGAVILARAGVKRIGAEVDGSILEFDQMLPAPGQGALALEVRADDERTAARIAPLNHAATAASVTAERTLLSGLGGGCQAPIAGIGTVDGDLLTLRGLVADPLGKTILIDSCSGPAGDPAAIGAQLARMLLDRGAAALLDRPGADTPPGPS
jgi:hydroxymethylbilane synthase